MRFSGFYHKKYLHRPIWPKPNFWHLGRFGYKKASKMWKFLFFQNLQNLSFLSMYTFMGIFSMGKKLYPIEVRSAAFYLVMDDPIMYVIFFRIMYFRENKWEGCKTLQSCSMITKVSRWWLFKSNTGWLRRWFLWWTRSWSDRW